MSPLSRLQKQFAGEGLTPEVVDLFRLIVLTHYERNARPLPWRETSDPYAILVSEVMLQQTQVDRVKGKYESFLAAFPDIDALAEAPLQQVLAQWQGLGYNRRAVHLKGCAEVIRELFNGVVPRSAEQLETLPGIGHYTARAVAAFAFGTPSAFIETNIRAVFIHLFFPDREKVHDREILPLVEASLDRENPRQWYYALMDFGVDLKRTNRNPARRSAHHTRQSPFKGSNRELRSAILRAIIAQPGLKPAEIIALTEGEPEQIKENLMKMASEGLLQEMEGRYSIPH